MPQEIGRSKWQCLSPLQVTSGGHVIDLNKRWSRFQPHSVKFLTMYRVGPVICVVTARGIPTMFIIHETMHFVLLHFIKPCEDKYSNMYTY